MASDLLLLEVADQVATVTINRADKLNALNAEVIGALGDMMAGLRARDDVRAIVLTGAGRAFVAGADIAGIAKAGPALEALARTGQAVFDAIEQGGTPVIAAVNGFALGGGCELALACHIRVASTAALFGLPEVSLGLIPGYGGTQRLPRLIGRGGALRLILSGDRIDATEAHRLGMCDVLAAPEALLDTARALATMIASRGPVAVARAIEAVHRGGDLPLGEAMAFEAQLFGALGRTEDMREGTTAFLEKRAPQFRGR
jgi:enoyl-CoA hydratase